MIDVDPTSCWVRLLGIACSLIRQVNAEQHVIDRWTLGGGTALMLHIDHRESHDVDIFLTDPQLLAFLDPEKRDFSYEIAPAAYTGDGAGFLKLAFKDIGEIDFIVGQSMTAVPTSRMSMEGVDFEVETIAEIITKKVVHRGAHITPRDIFDIAAAAERHERAILEALGKYPDAVMRTLDRLDKLNPDFVDAAIAQLAIRDGFRPVATTALKRTTSLLQGL